MTPETGSPPDSESPTALTRRLTDEQCRILIAVEEGRLFVNKHGRYEIDQETRPDRRARETLFGRALIERISSADYPTGYRITAKGKRVLRREISTRVSARLGAEQPPAAERTEVPQ